MTKDQKELQQQAIRLYDKLSQVIREDGRGSDEHTATVDGNVVLLALAYTLSHLLAIMPQDLWDRTISDFCAEARHAAEHKRKYVRRPGTFMH
jgi:fructose 1,6-bisphosphatase